MSSPKGQYLGYYPESQISTEPSVCALRMLGTHRDGEKRQTKDLGLGLYCEDVGHRGRTGDRPKT